MVWASAERVHGGLDAEELAALGITGPVLDFSVNLNPYGPCQPLLAAVHQAPLDSYPDPQARAPRRAWAELLDVGMERVAVGHGAAELFWALVRVLLPRGERVVIAEPTFSELRVAAQAQGADVVQVWAEAEHGFRFDMAKLVAAGRQARALYLCTPNNPTGLHTSAEQVRELARALPETTVVLDQSFLSLSAHAHELTARLPDNVVCVRSLTKDFALPGLRIAVLTAGPQLVEALERARPTWSTSAPAQAAIAEAARQQAFVRQSYAQMRADREQLSQLLRRRSLSPLPSQTTYQLVQVGQGAAFRARLLARGVAVRDCASFGLPGYVRIAARPAADLAQLERVLDTL